MITLKEITILTDLQHGFRSGRSCESQVINTVHDLITNFDKKHQTDFITLDFSKAFDCVPHNHLRHRLNSYGVKGEILRWLKAFLTHRQQQVIVEGEISSPTDVDSGVPQGTCLSPILFLCFINSLPESVNSKIRLFADDCVLYRKIISIDDQHILQEYLNALTKWAADWGMSFNETKCFVLSFHRTTPKIFFYSMNSIILKQVNQTKYLGIEFANTLKDVLSAKKIGKTSKIQLTF